MLSTSVSPYSWQTNMEYNKKPNPFIEENGMQKKPSKIR